MNWLIKKIHTQPNLNRLQANGTWCWKNLWILFRHTDSDCCGKWINTVSRLNKRLKSDSFSMSAPIRNWKKLSFPLCIWQVSIACPILRYRCWKNLFLDQDIFYGTDAHNNKSVYIMKKIKYIKLIGPACWLTDFWNNMRHVCRLLRGSTQKLNHLTTKQINQHFSFLLRLLLF